MTTRPPAQGPRLYDYFTDHDLTPPSLHGAIVAMAQTGVTVRGQPDPDGRVINSGAVGFRQRDSFDNMLRGNADAAKTERVSRAQKHREVRALMAKVDASHQRVLRLAYGPQDQVPGLKLGDNAQARKRLAGEETLHDEMQNRQRAKSHEKRYGCWRQVLPETPSVKAAFAVYLGERVTSHAQHSIIHWLVNVAKPSQINEAQEEALALVREAWSAWQDVAGRRVRAAAFEREELVKPWQ